MCTTTVSGWSKPSSLDWSFSSNSESSRLAESNAESTKTMESLSPHFTTHTPSVHRNLDFNGCRYIMPCNCDGLCRRVIFSNHRHLWIRITAFRIALLQRRYNHVYRWTVATLGTVLSSAWVSLSESSSNRPDWWIPSSSPCFMPFALTLASTQKDQSLIISASNEWSNSVAVVTSRS